MRVLAHDMTTASRAESGCIPCPFSESVDNEEEFSLTRIWRDTSSCDRYAGSDYVRAFTSNHSSGMLEKQPAHDKWR